MIGTDGSRQIGAWGRDVRMGPSVSVVLQDLDLIVDHVDHLVAGRELTHRGHEVLAVPAGVDPGGADHDGAGQRCKDRLFSQQFGPPVDTQRRSVIVHLLGMGRIGAPSRIVSATTR